MKSREPDIEDTGAKAWTHQVTTRLSDTLVTETALKKLGYVYDYQVSLRRPARIIKLHILDCR